MIIAVKHRVPLMMEAKIIVPYVFAGGWTVPAARDSWDLVARFWSFSVLDKTTLAIFPHRIPAPTGRFSIGAVSASTRVVKSSMGVRHHCRWGLAQIWLQTQF